MELGEKLRKARLEAGLSQRQLCEGVVTRNMLSQIENGSARPSMSTLQIFAQRLGKSVSFFLEETAVLSPNRPIVEEARSCFDSQRYAVALEALQDYRSPDDIYDREKGLLETLCYLELAQEALENGKEGYARELLNKAQPHTAYCAPELQRKRLLLLGRIRGEWVSDKLPSMDEEMMLRAEETRNSKRAAALLDACEDQESVRWNYLRGKAWLAEQNYEKASTCLLLAEPGYKIEIPPLLEICFREMGDYKRAYEYACKQK